MPNINLGVRTEIIDRSQFLVGGDSEVKLASLGAFEKGSLEPVLIKNTSEFIDNFGFYENAKDKSAYVSIYNMVKYSPVYVANVYNDDVWKYGWVKVFESSVDGSMSGSSNKDYVFNNIEVIGSGDGSNTEYSYVTMKKVYNESAKIMYVIGGENYIASVDSGGNIVGEHIVSGSISGSDVSIIFDTAPDNGSDIVINYVEDVLFIIFAKSKGDWVNKYKISIESVDTENKMFDIVIRDDNNYIVESFSVGRGETQLDGFGNLVYIENVINDSSNIIYIVNNKDILNDKLPSVQEIQFSNGISCDDVSVSDYGSVINNFYDNNNEWDIFVGSGLGLGVGLQSDDYNSLINMVFSLVDAKKRYAFLDTIDDTVDNICDWAENLPANMRVSFYSPAGYISYNGLTVKVFASSLVGVSYILYCVNNDQKYMPPAGVSRGIVNVIKLDKYYDDVDMNALKKANINVIRKYKNYGIVIFGDFTFQKYLSDTSFMNAVLTLNDMVKDLEEGLLFIDFELINESSYTLLNNFIVNYLKGLSRYSGTIESNFVVQFGDIEVAKRTKEISVDIVFAFQSVAHSVKLKLVYTSSGMISQVA